MGLKLVSLGNCHRPHREGLLAVDDFEEDPFPSQFVSQYQVYS